MTAPAEQGGRWHRRAGMLSAAVVGFAAVVTGAVIGLGSPRISSAPIRTAPPPALPVLPSVGSGGPPALSHPGSGAGPPPVSLVTGAAFPGWTVTTESITVDRRLRQFLVARPATVTVRTLPVLVVLHGQGLGPADMARISGFPPVVKQAVIVYPEGLGNSWNAGACCATAHALGVDDVKFLSAVVKSVLSTQRVTSAASVFLVGYSNGGRMAYQMACQRPGLFKAVAAVEAVPVASCNQRATVPFLVVASTGDPLVNIDGRRPPITIGGYVQPTVTQVVGQLRVRDGCSTSAQTVVAGQLTSTTWATCRSGAQVWLDTYAGNRHRWPAGAPGTPSAESQVWAFFQRG